MFKLDEFIVDLRASLAERSRQTMKEIVARAVSDPASLFRTIGEPRPTLREGIAPRTGPHGPKCCLGTGADYVAAQPPLNGSDWHVWGTRGQHVLATCPQ